MVLHIELSDELLDKIYGSLSDGVCLIVYQIRSSYEAVRWEYLTNYQIRSSDKAIR